MHWEIGGYKPSDIEVVAAIDIDQRKGWSGFKQRIFTHQTAPPRLPGRNT